MERAEYDRMAALEDTMWWYRALHAGLIDRLRRLSLPNGARVLDAGCGTGGLLRRVGQTMPGLELTGLEYDARAAAIAAAKSAAPVLKGTVNALSFATDNFDAIISADVLCHSQVNEAAALTEFHRCLKSGGSLLLNLPAYEWMKSSHDRHVHTQRRYTATSARNVIEAAGFRVAGIGYWNSLLFPIMLLHRMTVGRTKEQSDVQAFPPWQDRLFYAITGLERSMARMGFRLPFGGSVWVWAVKP
jgi:ubiquinone/menaquinone biosynthesis C-methylase UbiE